MKDNIATRRAILRKSFGALAGLGLANRTVVSAQSRAVDRITVCIYLLGGNDANNLVVPLDQYGSYAVSRGELALPSRSLLETKDVQSGSRIGFHPSTPQLRLLFEAGNLAVVANVGSRLRESQHREVSDLSYLRGGFLAAKWAQQVTGSAVITGFANKHQHSSLTLAGRRVAERQLAILGRSNSKSSAFMLSFPATVLGRQLADIAAILERGVTTGISQRSFFVVHGGYDTHSNQLPRHAAQLAELSEAMLAFHVAIKGLGLSREVTTYTDSDFGRTLKPNAIGGSDHGWGSHQLAMGGAVLGGRVYGSFPDLRLGSPHDADGTGIWRPAIAKDQHSATLAARAGASKAELKAAFPELDAYQPTVMFQA